MYGMDNVSDFAVRSMSTDLSSAIRAMIGRACIIEFGIIKEIIADGVVQVAVSVANSADDIRIVTCILISPVSSSLAVTVKPKVDDKVIIFSPRRFDADMFAVENNDFIINEYATGYTPFNCLAMLCNQEQADTYKNTVSVDEGKIEAKLAYSEDNDKNLLLFSTNEKGEVTLTSNSVVFSTKQDGSFELKNDKATFKSDSNGNIDITDGNGKSIKMSSSGTVINGKLTVK